MYTGRSGRTAAALSELDPIQKLLEQNLRRAEEESAKESRGYLNDLPGAVKNGIPNLNGFVVYDFGNRYRITLAKEW